MLLAVILFAVDALYDQIQAGRAAAVEELTDGEPQDHSVHRDEWEEGSEADPTQYYGVDVLMSAGRMALATATRRVAAMDAAAESPEQRAAQRAATREALVSAFGADSPVLQDELLCQLEPVLVYNLAGHMMMMFAQLESLWWSRLLLGQAIVNVARIAIGVMHRYAPKMPQILAQYVVNTSL